VINRALPPLCFLLGIAFVPWFSSAAASPRWALLSVAVPILLLFIKLRQTPAHWAVLGLLIWSTLTLLWMEVPLDGLHGLWLLSILAGIFCIGAELKSLKPSMLGLAYGLALNVPFQIAQVYGWTGFPQTASPGGLFLQTNVLGEALVLGVITSLFMRKWLLAAWLLLGMVMTHERTALLALMAAGATLALLREDLVSKPLMFAVILAMSLGLFVSSMEKSGWLSMQERVASWKDTVAGLKLQGNGIGSYWSMFPKHARHVDTAQVRMEYAHNEPLHYAFELGLGALFGLAALVYAALGRLDYERCLLVALIVQCMFAFPLHMPVTACVAALVAGRLARARSLAGLHQHDRRGAVGSIGAQAAKFSTGAARSDVHRSESFPAGSQLAQDSGYARG
jgi:hypothetical protein